MYRSHPYLPHPHRNGSPEVEEQHQWRQSPHNTHQTPKIVTQRPVWRTQRPARSYAGPVKAEIQYAQTLVRPAQGAKPPALIVDQAQDREAGECGEKEKGEELVQEDSEEDEGEDIHA